MRGRSKNSPDDVRTRSESPDGWVKGQEPIYKWQDILHPMPPNTAIGDIPCVMLERAAVSIQGRNDWKSLFHLAGKKLKVHIQGRIVVDEDQEHLLREYRGAKQKKDLNGQWVVITEVEAHTVALDPVTVWFRTPNSPWFEVQPTEEYRLTYDAQAESIRLFYCAYDFYMDQAKGQVSRYLLEEVTDDLYYSTEVDTIEVIQNIFIRRKSGSGMTVADIKVLVSFHAEWFLAEAINHMKDYFEERRRQHYKLELDLPHTPFFIWVHSLLPAGSPTPLPPRIPLAPILPPLYYPAKPKPPLISTRSTTTKPVIPPPLTKPTISGWTDPSTSQILPSIENHHTPTYALNPNIPATYNTAQNKWNTPYHGLYISPQYPHGLIPNNYNNLDIILATIFNARVPHPYWLNEPRCSDDKLNLSRVIDMFYRDWATKWRDTHKALICRYAPRIRERIGKEGLRQTELYAELDPIKMAAMYKGVRDNYKKMADEFTVDGIKDRVVMQHRRFRTRIGGEDGGVSASALITSSGNIVKGGLVTSNSGSRLGTGTNSSPARSGFSSPKRGGEVVVGGASTRELKHRDKTKISRERSVSPERNIKRRGRFKRKYFDEF